MTIEQKLKEMLNSWDDDNGPSTADVRRLIKALHYAMFWMDGVDYEHVEARILRILSGEER